MMNAQQPIAGPSSPRVTRSLTREARQPLATLPLSHFVPSSLLAPPSPLSISHKRSAPGSGSPSSASGGSRKVSRTEKSDSVRPGLGSGRRGDPEITPKVKERLERDELGLGRSPARRLFGPDSRTGISGISGISPVPLPSPSALQSPSASQAHSPFLAPSPPLSPRTRTFTPLPTTEMGENGVMRNIHDPGFSVHADGVGVGIGTPDSRRHQSLPPPLSYSATSSPSTSTTGSRFEDQENIPPSGPSSRNATPRKKGVLDSGSSASGLSSGGWDEGETITQPKLQPGLGLGMGTPGRSGRSKLVQMMRMRGVSNPESEEGETESEGEEEEGEGLTPGRKGREHGGKERLVREGDVV